MKNNACIDFLVDVLESKIVKTQIATLLEQVLVTIDASDFSSYVEFIENFKLKTAKALNDFFDKKMPLLADRFDEKDLVKLCDKILPCFNYTEEELLQIFNKSIEDVINADNIIDGSVDGAKDLIENKK